MDIIINHHLSTAATKNKLSRLAQLNVYHSLLSCSNSKGLSAKVNMFFRVFYLSYAVALWSDLVQDKWPRGNLITERIQQKTQTLIKGHNMDNLPLVSFLVTGLACAKERERVNERE